MWPEIWLDFLLEGWSERWDINMKRMLVRMWARWDWFCVMSSGKCQWIFGFNIRSSYYEELLKCDRCSHHPVTDQVPAHPLYES